MSQKKVPHLKDAMTEPTSHKHVLKKLTNKVFSRRRTTTDVNKEPALPSSRTPSSAVPKEQQRSSLLTSSTSSRHHSALHGVNTFIPQPASSLQAESHIPRPKVHRKSREFIKAASEDLSLNLEGRYPAMTGPKKRNSDAQVNPRPPRASFNTSLPRSNTLNNVTTETSSCVPGFMRPTSSSTARSSLRGSPGPSLPAKTETTTRPNQRRTPRSSLPAPTESMTRTDRYRGGASGHRSSVPSFSRPIPSRMKLDHVEDGKATSRQVPAVDITPDSVNQKSYGVMSDIGEGQSSAVAISTTPTANNGDYSFAASEETIGPASSGPTPLGQDVIYESANEAPEPPEFEMPERFSISSDSHTPQGTEPNTETPGSEIKDNILPDMGGKNINPQMISTPQPTAYWLGRLMALSDRFRTEALTSQSPIISFTPQGFDLNSMHDESQRIRLVFMHLSMLCATKSAQDSLEEFRVKYMQKMDEDIGPLGQGTKVREKRGVFEKLMGRKGGDK